MRSTMWKNRNRQPNDLENYVMFIRDGIVYGGEPDAPMEVEYVKPLQDMMMLIRFNNGETRLFDATVLQGPVFEPLHDEKIFSSPVIDHGVVTWKDGEIDCAPEFMYSHSYEYAIAE